MAGSPRVLVLSNMVPSPVAPQYGVFVRRQADALSALGVRVRVVGLERGESGALATPRKYAALWRRAAAAVRTFSPEVVIAHYVVPTGSIARRIARRGGIPYIVIAHGGDVAHAETSGVAARLMRHALRDAAAVVAVSPELAERVRPFAGDRPIEVIDVGVDRALFRPGEVDGARFAPAASRPLIVQVGNLIERKNPERLAAAVAEVRRRRGGGELWIAGDGPLAARLQDLAHVRLLGAVVADDIPDLLRHADAAALVSLREGYGLGALEAVACGVPLVLSADIPVAADLPPTSAVPVDQYDVQAIADGIERALDLVRNDPAGQAIADAHATTVQAQRLLDLVERTRT
jgi:teichuronic acid biosynthesis glycosyltransferase TuaC